MQASGLPDAAILAGKREAAKQVRPDFEPVKPRLLLRGRQFHQLGGFGGRDWLHGSMLPACTIEGQRPEGKYPPKPSGHSTGLKIKIRGCFQGQEPRPLCRVRPSTGSPAGWCSVRNNPAPLPTALRAVYPFKAKGRRESTSWETFQEPRFPVGERASCRPPSVIGRLRPMTVRAGPRRESRSGGSD